MPCGRACHCQSWAMPARTRRLTAPYRPANAPARTPLMSSCLPSRLPARLRTPPTAPLRPRPALPPPHIQPPPDVHPTRARSPPTRCGAHAPSPGHPHAPRTRWCAPSPGIYPDANVPDRLFDTAVLLALPRTDPVRTPPPCGPDRTNTRVLPPPRPRRSPPPPPPAPVGRAHPKCRCAGSPPVDRSASSSHPLPAPPSSCNASHRLNIQSARTRSSAPRADTARTTPGSAPAAAPPPSAPATVTETD